MKGSNRTNRGRSRTLVRDRRLASQKGQVALQKRRAVFVETLGALAQRKIEISGSRELPLLFKSAALLVHFLGGHQKHLDQRRVKIRSGCQLSGRRHQGEILGWNIGRKIKRSPREA